MKFLKVATFGGFLLQHLMKKKDIKMFIRGKTLFCNIENKKDKTKSTSMIETVFNSLAEYLTWER